MKYDNWKTEAIEYYIKEREQEIEEAKKELERRKLLIEKLKPKIFDDYYLRSYKQIRDSNNEEEKEKE